MNGKKMAWQGVALLPFIDPIRLLEAMAKYYPDLTEEEVRRNKWGDDIIFVASDHPLYPFFEALYGKRKNSDVRFLYSHMECSYNISSSRFRLISTSVKG